MMPLSSRLALTVLAALAVTSIALAFSESAGSAEAHPLGNFTINRYARIELGADAVRLHYVVDMAEIPAFQEIRAIDRDGDGLVAQEEAAVYLARFAGSVTVLVRGAGLDMSDYLVRQIERTPSITVRLNTRIVRAHGTSRLEALEIADSASRTTERVPAAALFVLIGAGPHTDWLAGKLQRDQQGYVMTGRHVTRGGAGQPDWPVERSPYQFETSLPGVFAIGDVRHQAPRGVTAAVYEGTTAVWSATS